MPGKIGAEVCPQIDLPGGGIDRRERSIRGGRYLVTVDEMPDGFDPFSDSHSTPPHAQRLDNVEAREFPSRGTAPWWRYGTGDVSWSVRALTLDGGQRRLSTMYTVARPSAPCASTVSGGLCDDRPIRPRTPRP